MRPLAIDLFCGLGGWADGLLAEGYDVIGFDIERHVYGEHRYPCLLVLQDVLTLHGSQFRNADLIVASPPCQAYSYRAMPWKRAKALPPPDNTLFEACFRIQREACEAAGRHIPLIVENVRGAQPWVGRARWNFGSFYLWGDVPALMPITLKAAKVPGFRFDGSGRSFQSASVETSGTKNNGGSWFAIAHNTTSGHGRNPVNGMTRSSIDETGRKSQGMNWSDPTKRGQDFTRIAGRQEAGSASGTIGRLHMDGTKQPGLPGERWFDEGAASFASKSPARKAASAMIAKIPMPLARWIGRAFKPVDANLTFFCGLSPLPSSRTLA